MMADQWRNIETGGRMDFDAIELQEGESLRKNPDGTSNAHHGKW
jgi:hypothetical protein